MHGACTTPRVTFLEWRCTPSNRSRHLPASSSRPGGARAVKPQRGAERGETIPIQQGSALTLGRSSTAGRKVRDSHLSRIHLEVDFSGQRAVVRDLNSRNGVFLNGRRVEQKTLTNTDRILAGEQVWDVVYVHDLSDLAATFVLFAYAFGV